MPTTLYTFGLSVWGAAAELAVHELGHESVEKKQINLVNGENFHPTFVKLNPNASIPTLYTEGEVFTNTTDIISYLVKTKHAKSADDRTFIEKVHEEKIDPNFALLLARNEEELAAKGANVPGTFIQNRQTALEKHSTTPEASPHKEFYDAKIQGNGDLLAIYKSQVPDAAKEAFFKASTAHVSAIHDFILGELNDRLKAKIVKGKNTFLSGDNVPGEEDFHVGAWLARIAMTSGAHKSSEGIEKLEGAIGAALPESVKDYWNAWSARESWIEVYKETLH